MCIPCPPIKSKPTKVLDNSKKYVFILESFNKAYTHSILKLTNESNIPAGRYST